MREVEIALRSGLAESEIVRAIDVAARETGLTLVSKGSLGKYAGCTHWHYKLGNETGTLEITYWPSAARAWFSLRANRYALWMESLVPQLKQDIERWLQTAPRTVHA